MGLSQSLCHNIPPQEITEKIIFPEIIPTNSDLARFAYGALINHDETHGWVHATRAYRNLHRLLVPAGEEILPGLVLKTDPIRLPYRVQQCVAQAAVILHDVIDSKYPGKAPVTRYFGDPAYAYIAMRIIDNISFTKTRQKGIIPFEDPNMEAVRLAVRDSDWIDRVDVTRCWEYNKHIKGDIVGDGTDQKLYYYTADRLQAKVASFIVTDMLPVRSLLSSDRARELIAPAESEVLGWLNKYGPAVGLMCDSNGIWKIPPGWSMPPLHPDAKPMEPSSLTK
jgi:hypothetical protein